MERKVYLILGPKISKIIKWPTRFTVQQLEGEMLHAPRYDPHHFACKTSAHTAATVKSYDHFTIRVMLQLLKYQTKQGFQKNKTFESVNN